MSNDDDWTASLCDRVNELLREHPVYHEEVTNGADCSNAIQTIHGYCGRLQSTIAGLRYDKKVLLKACQDALVFHAYDSSNASELKRTIRAADNIRTLQDAIEKATI